MFYKITQMTRKGNYIPPISKFHEIDLEEDLMAPRSHDYVTDDDDDDDEPETDPAMTKRPHDYNVWDHVW